MSKYLKPKIKILKKLNLKLLPYFTNKINFKYNNKIINNYNKIINMYKINIINNNYFKYIINYKHNKFKNYCNLKKFMIFNYYNLFSTNNKKLNIILFYLGLTKTLYQSFQLINHKFIFLNYKLIKFSNIICKKNDIISINNLKYNKNLLYKNLLYSNIYTIYKYKNNFLYCFKSMKFKIK